MKIFSNTNFPSITVKWTIYRGNTQVKEDFSGALFYVFLVNNGNEIKLSASYTNGAIQFTLPIGTEEGQIFPAIGTYGIKAIWVKDAQGHNVNLDLCHKRCLSVIEDLFAISDSEDPGIANTEAAVTLEVKSNIATYGYDGLDSYELAVFMGLTNLDKKNWLANLNEMSVKQAQINNQETARVTEENKRVTAENLRQQTQKALEEQIAEVQDSRVQIDQMLNGGSNRREVSLPLTHFSAVTKTTAATFKMYLGVSEDNEAKVTTAFAKGDNGIYSVEQETGVLYCKIAYIDDTVLGSKSPMIECSQEGVATGKVIGTESIEGSIVYVAADEPTYKLYITVTSAKRSWKEAAFVESGSNFVTSVIDLKDGDQMLSSDSAIEYLYRVNGGVLTTGATLIPTTISSPITTAGKYVYQIATNTPVSEGELKVVKVTVQNQNAKGVYEYLEYLDNGLTIGTESTKPSNVRERYKLVDKNGQQFGSYIDVYKDSSVKEVKLEGQYLKITYILATGAENTVSINLSDFITEAEVGDGLHVVDSKIKVKLNNDPETTNYLKFVGTGSNRALSLEGIENYMNTIEEDRETRYQAAEGTSTTVGGTSRWGRFNQNENSRSATATQRINNCDAAVTRANTAAAGCEAYDTRMSDVEGDVDDLQSEVDDLAQKVGEFPMVEVSPQMINGYYVDSADGQIKESQNFKRTQYINVYFAKTMSVNVSIATEYNCFYDANKTFVKSIRLEVGVNNIDVPIGCSYFIASMNSSASDPEISITDYRKGLSVSEYNDIENSISNAPLNGYEPKMINGEYANTDGTIGTSSSFKRTNKINVMFAKKLSVTLSTYGSSYNCFYYADNTLAKNIRFEVGTNEYEVPDGACYLICSVNKSVADPTIKVSEYRFGITKSQINDVNKIPAIEYRVGTIKLSNYDALSIKQDTKYSRVLVNFGGGSIVFVDNNGSSGWVSCGSDNYIIPSNSFLYYNIASKNVVISSAIRSSVTDILLVASHSGYAVGGCLLDMKYQNGIASYDYNARPILRLSDYSKLSIIRNKSNGSCSVNFGGAYLFYIYAGETKYPYFQFSTDDYVIANNNYLYYNIKNNAVEISVTQRPAYSDILLLQCHSGYGVQGWLNEIYQATLDARRYEYSGERICVGQKNYFSVEEWKTFAGMPTAIQGCANYGKFLFVAGTNSETSQLNMYVFNLETSALLANVICPQNLHYNTLCFGNKCPDGSSIPYLYVGAWDGTREIDVFQVNDTTYELTLVQTISVASLSSNFVGVGQMDFGLDKFNEKLYLISYDTDVTNTTLKGTKTHICECNLPNVGNDVALTDSDLTSHFEVPLIYLRQQCLFDDGRLYVITSENNGYLKVIDTHYKRISNIVWLGANADIHGLAELEGMFIYNDTLIINSYGSNKMYKITF